MVCGAASGVGGSVSFLHTAHQGSATTVQLSLDPLVERVATSPAYLYLEYFISAYFELALYLDTDVIGHAGVLKY